MCVGGTRLCLSSGSEAKGVTLGGDSRTIPGSEKELSAHSIGKLEQAIRIR